MGGSADSVFRLRGAFQTRSILAKRGEIRYQLGAKKEWGPKKKTLTLFGKWKVSRDWAVAFEIVYPGGEKRKLVFTAEFDLDAQNHLSARLAGKKGGFTGISLIWTRQDLAKDGKLYIIFERLEKETRIEAGYVVPW